MTHSLDILRAGACISAVATFTAFVSPVQAAVVAFDGGITLWISYDDLDAPGATIADTITEGDALLPGASCTPTNNARAALGSPNSPPSCPGGTGTCTGEEKITGDISKLADYIYQSTEGAHYLRRVYVSDEGRAWDSSDIKWNVGSGGSSTWPGWSNPEINMNLNSAYRTCIHDVVHHEYGHYLHNMPDRYARSGDYYYGTVAGDATTFQVDVTQGDGNTFLASNFPHLFVDTTNARLVADYDPPGPGTVTGEVLTPDLLTDADATNDGPNRAHHGFTTPFAQDEWSLIPGEHVDLTGVHTEGSFASPGARPAVDIVFIGDDEPHPGTALMLDRSGSMGVTTNGITAAQFVQEAGMFLYHSSEDEDLVGTYLYNQGVEELFPYDEYDSSNDLPATMFRNASGLTDIAGALESAIDALIAEHGEGGVNGAEIYLMSDGRQTTGANLWDQVDRANQRGIKIHTFSFGDADTTTMNDIAGGTGGDTTPMSERDDAAELKMLMTRKFSTGRGLTPIYVFKGVMRDTINLGATQLYGGQFAVPPKTLDLKFYTFLHTGDASQEFNLQLKAPSGATFDSPPPDNVTEKARLNGVRVDAPEPGLWTYTIVGRPGSGLPSEPIEIAAYANNRELKGRTWIEDISPKKDALLRAQLHFRYPLTDMKVGATFYSAGVPIWTVPMFDDGTNGDDFGGDGVYATRLDLGGDIWKKLLSQVERRTEKLRIEVEFDVTTESGPASRAHYETGFTPDMAARDYGRENKSAFKAWATTVLNLAEVNPDRPDRTPRIDDDHDDSGMGDPVKVPRGTDGKLDFVLVNARPLPSQLRVSLGQGVKAKVSAVRDHATKNNNGGASKQDDDKSTVVPGYVEKDLEPLWNDFVKLLSKHGLIQPPRGQQEGTSYLVDFYVDPEAKLGPRDLRIQFDRTILEKPNAMFVAR